MNSEKNHVNPIARFLIFSYMTGQHFTTTASILVSWFKSNDLKLSAAFHPISGDFLFWRMTDSDGVVVGELWRVRDKKDEDEDQWMHVHVPSMSINEAVKYDVLLEMVAKYSWVLRPYLDMKSAKHRPGLMWVVERIGNPIGTVTES